MLLPGKFPLVPCPVVTDISSQTLHNQCISIKPLCNQCHVFSTYQSVFSVQIKNCEPFVFGPEFAIDRMPVINIDQSQFESKKKHIIGIGQASFFLINIFEDNPEDFVYKGFVQWHSGRAAGDRGSIRSPVRTDLSCKNR